MSTLNRYMLKEIVSPFAAWLLLLFMVFFVMAFLRGIDVLLGSAVTLGDLGLFFVYLAPQFLVQAGPLALLLALLLAMGRMSEDGELLAMRSLGLSPSRLLVSALGLSSLVAFVLALLVSYGQPWGARQVTALANQIIKRNLVGDVRPGVFHQELLGLTLFVGAVDGAGFSHVMIYDGRSSVPWWALAARGQVRVGTEDEHLVLELESGAIHRKDGSAYTVAGFEKAQLALTASEAFTLKNRFAAGSSSEGSLVELWKGRAEVSKMLALSFKLTQMLSPLVFVWAAFPLGFVRRPGARARSFLITLLGFAAYYLFARLGLSLGEKELVAPWLGPTLPNLIFAALGALGLWALQKGRA